MLIYISGFQSCLFFMIKLNLSKYFFYDNISPSEFDGIRKRIMLLIFLSFSGCFFILLGILNIIDRDYEHIWLDIVGFVFSLIFILLTIKRKMLGMLTYGYVVLLELILGFLFLSGGVENTGVLYFILIPLPALFMLGLKKGLIISVSNFLLAIYLTITAPPWFPVYDPVIVQRVYVIYAAVTLLASVFVFIVAILERNFMESHKKLFQSREDYKDLATIREKFMSVYTHDLKMQIASIHNIISLVIEKYDLMDEEKRKKMIEILKSTSQHSVSFMKDFLEWATDQDQSIQFKPENINIRELIFNVIEVYDVPLKQKSIYVSTEISVAIMVYADSNMLSTVIRNILSNAIKFSDDQTMIVIRTKHSDEWFYIEIEDFGVGMDSETCRRLMAEIDVDTHYKSNEKYAHGLGVVLSKEYIKKHNGKIEIESEPGQGTLVRIKLPQAASV